MKSNKKDANKGTYQNSIFDINICHRTHIIVFSDYIKKSRVYHQLCHGHINLILQTPCIMFWRKKMAYVRDTFGNAAFASFVIRTVLYKATESFKMHIEWNNILQYYILSKLYVTITTSIKESALRIITYTCLQIQLLAKARRRTGIGDCQNNSFIKICSLIHKSLCIGVRWVTFRFNTNCKT